MIFTKKLVLTTFKAIRKNAELQKRFKKEGKINASDQMELLNDLTKSLEVQYNFLIAILITMVIIMFIIGLT